MGNTFLTHLQINFQRCLSEEVCILNLKIACFNCLLFKHTHVEKVREE